MSIKEFITGHWYVYKGERTINFVPEMDFILDGLPHQCNKGDGVFASFYDSPQPDAIWSWGIFSALKDFYDVSDEYKIDKLQEFLCK